MSVEKKKSESSVFISQMILFSIGPFGGAIFSFIASTVATWLIAPEELGKVSLFLTAYTLLTMIANLGLNRSYLREYSNVADKEKLLYNCVITSISFSLLLSLVIFIFREPISYLLFDNNDQLSTLMLALIIPFEVLGEYGVYVCRLEGHSWRYAISVIVDKASYLLYIVILYLLGVRAYRNIIYARVLAIITKSIVNVLIERKSYRFCGRPDFVMIKAALQYGVPYMPALICSWVLHSMDKYSLRIWSSYTEIGLYQSAYALVAVLAILRGAFSSFWTPLAYKWYDEGKNYRYFEEVGKHITTLLMICSALLTLLRNVLFHIYKPEYSAAANIMPFLMFVISMETISYVSGCGINLKKKTIYNLVATGIACIINLIGNYFLVPNLGGIGASISTGVSSVVFVLVKTIVSRQIWYKFPVSGYVINVLSIIAMSACAILFNCWWIDLLFTIWIIGFNFKSLKQIIQIARRFVKDFYKKRVKKT